MSTQPLESPEEESQMMLILGKPGGGKGTISGKILKVRHFGMLLYAVQWSVFVHWHVLCI
jgi:hypothetical protein